MKYRIFQVNAFVAVGVLLLGMYGYLGDPDRSFKALISPFFGLMLLMMIPALQRGKRVAFLLVWALTFSYGVGAVSIVVGAGKIADPERRIRRILEFTAISAVCFAGTVYYLRHELKQRQK